MLEQKYKDSSNMDNEPTMPSSNYIKKKNSSKVRQALGGGGGGDPGSSGTGDGRYQNPFKKQLQ
jgi:hypothetical protein